MSLYTRMLIESSFPYRFTPALARLPRIRAAARSFAQEGNHFRQFRSVLVAGESHPHRHEHFLAPQLGFLLDGFEQSLVPAWSRFSAAASLSRNRLITWGTVSSFSTASASGVSKSNSSVKYRATFSGISFPTFALGLLLMEIFSVSLGWLPTVGADSWKHYILPSITLGAGVAAVMARFTRASFVEILQDDYIRTARAKG